MLAKLREEVAGQLARHRECLLATGGGQGTWALPVQCHSTGLVVDCLVPRWTDVAHRLADAPEVVLVFTSEGPPLMSWLQLRGRSELAASPDWGEILPERVSHPESLYVVARVQPERIDLIDERRGWGVQETIEILNRERNRK